MQATKTTQLKTWKGKGKLCQGKCKQTQHPDMENSFLRHEIRSLHASLPAAIPRSLCSHIECSKHPILISLHLANRELSTYSNETLEVE